MVEDDNGLGIRCGEQEEAKKSAPALNVTKCGSEHFCGDDHYVCQLRLGHPYAHIDSGVQWRDDRDLFVSGEEKSDALSHVQLEVSAPASGDAMRRGSAAMPKPVPPQGNAGEHGGADSGVPVQTVRSGDLREVAHLLRQAHAAIYGGTWSVP